MRHPKLDVGDKVRVKQKKGALDKERKPDWGGVRVIEAVEKENNTVFYKLQGSNRGYLRTDLLLVESAQPEEPVPAEPEPAAPRRRLRGKQPRST